MQNLKLHFAQAIELYERNELNKSAIICEEMLNKGFVFSEVLHLLGLCLMDVNPARAKTCFSKALTLTPQNQAIKIACANVSLKLGDYVLAKPLFEQILKHNHAELDALYGLAFINHTDKNFESALFYIEKALALDKGAVRFYVLKSRIYLDLMQFDEALTAINCAEKLGITERVLLEKGLILRHSLQSKAALIYFERLSDKALSHYLQGCTYYDLGKLTDAEAHLLLALELQPYSIESHEALNKLYWESHQLDKFLTSYQLSIENKCENVALYLSYLTHLFLSHKYEAAQVVVDEAIAKYGRISSLLQVKGALAAYFKHDVKALELYQEALKTDDANIRLLIDIAGIYIKFSQYERAFEYIQKAQKISPNNQEVIAYLGLCYRLQGNSERYNWLNNYDKYISVKKLPTPAGYKTFNEFWLKLKESVARLHTSLQQPLDQSVRYGSQTIGYLFSHSDPVIQTYKKLLSEHIQQYIDALPKDDTHPLLRRNKGKFQFSGAWSVSLGEAGFHKNHVHPQGWLSVCTYLDIPQEINAKDNTKQGWLKLGESALSLNEKEVVDRYICPEEGLCVIFPSFIWHGTVALNIPNVKRMTLPCDILPM